ncbi:MAG: helix-turn-helix transcriptional regulator [Rhizomicrobium sp.]|nr:helix-turn-helix transcriptional regulator [Rhizomicrobium sp.]
MKSSQEPNLSPDRRKRSRLLDAEVGQSIRHHRKSAKMTLQGLADKLGIAYQQVQKYETGVNRVGAGRLMEIAEILNIPVSNFFGAPAAASAEATNDSDAALLGRQLLVNFMKIKDPEKRKEALAYIKSLAEFDMA